MCICVFTCLRFFSIGLQKATTCNNGDKKIGELVLNKLFLEGLKISHILSK